METCLVLDYWSHERHTFLVKYLDNSGKVGCTVKRETTEGPNKVFMSIMCIKKYDCCNC